MATVTDEELEKEFGEFGIPVDDLCIIDKRRYSKTKEKLLSFLKF